MKFKSAITALITSLVLAGCAGTTIGLRSTNSPSLGASPPPPGTSYGSAAIQADVTPGAFLGLAFLGYIYSGMQDNFRRWDYGSSWSKPPQLAEDRDVAVRDCAAPLGPLYANLRCK